MGTSARISILGTEERLKAMDSSHLRAYMKEHYTIENTVISIAGNIDDSVIDLMEKHFGEFDVKGVTEVPCQLFKAVNSSTKRNGAEPHLYLVSRLQNWRPAAIRHGCSQQCDWRRHELRLFQEIREKRGLAYSVYSYHSSHADSGLFTIYAGTAPKQTKVLDLTKSTA